MFISHPNGTKELVYEIEVNIPPKGWVYNNMINSDGDEIGWEKAGIEERDPIAQNQYWERPLPDFDWDKERRKEKARQVSDEGFVDPTLEDYRYEEWYRRLNGFWFMNNGVPTYITGTHYFYLTHWRLDGIYPDYRDSDRKFFLLWRWAEQNPDCYGLVESARRRSGKTYRSTCILYDRATRNFNHWAGIQSKTDEDAQAVFNKLVNSAMWLPDFFVPTYDLEKGKRPKNEFLFQTPNKRGKKALEEDDSIALDSKIDYRASNNIAYDGQKLGTYLRDECGKTETANIYAGWGVLKPVFRTGTKTINGKSLYTTTIEEGGSEPFRLLWNASDPTELDANGRTKSGMVRIFTPSFENDDDFIDKYGICDTQASKEFQLSERLALQDDPAELAGLVRRNPFDIKEAFFLSDPDSPFDPMLINQQLSDLRVLREPLYTQGNLVWSNNVRDKSVIFVPNSKGRFRIHKAARPEEYPWNAVNRGTRLFPGNATSIIAGIDPYDHKMIDTADGNKRLSKGAGYVFHKFDAMDTDLSETFLAEYINRPRDPNDFFEDMIRMCFFFGCKTVCERNKSGILNYFDSRGYSMFLSKEKGRRERGISANVDSKQKMSEVTDSYISNSVDKVVFPELLKDWLAFDLQNSTKNDASMAAGWALYGAYRIDRDLIQNNGEVTGLSSGGEGWSKDLIMRL